MTTMELPGRWQGYRSRGYNQLDSVDSACESCRDAAHHWRNCDPRCIASLLLATLLGAAWLACHHLQEHAPRLPWNGAGSKPESLASFPGQDPGPAVSSHSKSFCNATLDPPELSAARAFELPTFWRDICEQAAPGQPKAQHQEGKNWCWEWIKKDGCYAAGSTISWRDAQMRAAEKLKAPYPELVPMEPLLNPGLCEQHSFGEINVSRREGRMAEQWMKEVVSIYVLNRPSDLDRLEGISRHLEDLGVDFQRWPGVDFTVPESYKSAKMAGLVPWEFNFTLALQTYNDKLGAHLGIAGSMGRSAAHLSIMKHASERARQGSATMPEASAAASASRGKPLVLVLEDDARLGADFAVKLKRLIEQEVPCDWVVISLRSYCPFGKCVSPHLTRVQPDGNEPESHCRHGVNLGFEGTLYRVSTIGDLQVQLTHAIFDAERPRCLDIDVALASVSDRVAYYAVPAMQAPGFLASFQGPKPSVHLMVNAASYDQLEEEQEHIDKALDMKEVERARAYRLRVERKLNSSKHHRKLQDGGSSDRRWGALGSLTHKSAPVHMRSAG